MKVDQPTGGRVVALDLVKGWLVLLMVLYHWLNYFVSPQGEFYKYLRFITPSFIFLAGFLVAHLYLRKYRADDARLDGRLYGRLFQRGFRLMAVFLVLNAAGIVALKGVSAAFGGELAAFFANTRQVFFAGNGNPGAFAILVPISYLLMFLAGHLWLTQGRARVDYVLCVALFALMYFLRRSGVGAGYLELFTFGILGLIFGRLAPETLGGLGRFRLEIAAVWVGYLIWLTEWNEILPMQVLGVLATLALLYALVARCDGVGWGQRRVILLGSYSLPAYIVQIGVLLILDRLLPRSLDVVRLVVSFVAAVVLTSAAVELTAWLRQRLRLVDATYRFVFG